MPLITIALPVSIATKKRILHDNYQAVPIRLKRGTWLYDMVSRAVVPLEVSKEGLLFQYQTNRFGTVDPSECALQLDRHYHQLRNETIATHIRLSNDTTIVTNAMMRYNELFAIETDVDISLESMLKSWTRWCQAQKAKKNDLKLKDIRDGVQPKCNFKSVDDADLEQLICDYISQHNHKFTKVRAWEGIHTKRVFQLCAYVYRYVGHYDIPVLATQFNKPYYTVRKAAETFRQLLQQWSKQGIEPPQLIQSPIKLS